MTSLAELAELAEFSCADFSPFLPDDRQVNPEVYGAELAYWLCRALASAGLPTSYPEHEDWGWYLDYRNEAGCEFAVHCGNVDGSDSRWFLGLRRFGRKSFGRDKPPFSEAAPLIEAIRRCLEEHPAVAELSWLYSDPDAT